MCELALLLRESSLSATDSGPPALGQAFATAPHWEAPEGPSLETDSYFRRGVGAQQGRVARPRSHSWLGFSRNSLLCPEDPCPAFYVCQIDWEQPDWHPGECLAHSEGPG